MPSVSGAEHLSDGHIVFLNGLIIGAHRNTPQLVRDVRRLRRRGYIHEFVSIYEDVVQVRMSYE